MIKNSLNDLVFFILAFLYVIAILINHDASSYLYITAFGVVNLVLFKKLQYHYIIFFIATMMPGLIIIFMMATIFSNSSHTGIYATYIWKTFHYKIYYINLHDAVNLVSRTLALALCSFMFIIHINIEKVTICAMKQGYLPIKIGYAILVTSNAFKFITAEFTRIRMAYQMRFRKKLGIHKMLYPLLISAARYSTTCGLSLETRGLNENKTFIEHCQEWQRYDTIAVIINILVITAITI